MIKIEIDGNKRKEMTIKGREKDIIVDYLVAFWNVFGTIANNPQHYDSIRHEFIKILMHADYAEIKEALSENEQHRI